MNWPAFWRGFRDGFTAGPLRRLVSGAGAESTTLIWRCYQTFRPIKGNPLLHVAQTGKGTFEIFEDGVSFLLYFPRPMQLPAELFYSLDGAKGRAAEVLGEAKP